ncbi:hypothetical protein CUMW_208320, partial [Citrus unshiu]
MSNISAQGFYQAFQNHRSYEIILNMSFKRLLLRNSLTLHRPLPVALQAKWLKPNLGIWIKLVEEDTDCLKWHRQRDANSVCTLIMAALLSNHLTEFAWGLANSKRPIFMDSLGRTLVFEEIKDKRFMLAGATKSKCVTPLC